MTPHRIVIGDIHGHYDALMSLLEAIAPGEEDKIYFLGDLIDRGPKSAQVVEFVIQNNYRCLRGNHEEMLIGVFENDPVCPEAFQAWLHSGGHATVASYNAKIPPEHIDWMRNLPLYLDLGDIWLVHAGINPQLSVEEQTSEQFCWIREEFHSQSQPYFADKLIITGHTITFTLPGVKPGKIAAGPGWLGIETGAYHRSSGWLTGLDITENIVYQVNTHKHSLRKLPLEKAMVQVNPSRVAARR